MATEEQDKFDAVKVREIIEDDYKAKGRLSGPEANYWQHLQVACNYVEQLEAENKRLKEAIDGFKARREYKYRGKRKDNGEWIVGSLIQFTRTKESYIAEQGGWLNQEYDGDIPVKGSWIIADCYEVDPDTVSESELLEK